MRNVIVANNYILYEDGVWFSIKSRRFLKPDLNRCGYERVQLCTNGKKTKKFFTHIKVVEYFGDCKGNRIPKNTQTLRELGLSIDHLDRNKHHNNIKNLELVTHQENCRRKFIVPKVNEDTEEVAVDLSLMDDSLPF